MIAQKITFSNDDRLEFPVICKKNKKEMIAGGTYKKVSSQLTFSVFRGDKELHSIKIINDELHKKYEN